MRTTASAPSRSLQQPLSFVTSAEVFFPDDSTHTSRRQPRQSCQLVFQLAAADTKGSHTKPRPGALLVRRPVALLALVPRSSVLFLAGAVSGAIGKTLTAPLDRVKILLQVKGGLQEGALKAAASKGGVWASLLEIGRADGLKGYWKGNLPQILRVIPYSAIQLYSYEVFKSAFLGENKELSMPRRLAAGGCAGMTATLCTYPLDTLRFRLAVDPAAKSIRGASAALLREGSYGAFFRGLGASLLGIAPYMALELATFDWLSQRAPDLPPFVRGFSAALVATTVCYPLDTVRRQMQLGTGPRIGWVALAATMLRHDGVKGFYRGFVPNALKNLPNKGVRLATFDAAKKLLTTAETALAEEVEREESLQMAPGRPKAAGPRAICCKEPPVDRRLQESLQVMPRRHN